MRESIEMPKSIFYLIIAICGIIIMSTSIDILFRAKDVGLYNQWIQSDNLNSYILNLTAEEQYSTYLQMCISTFIVRAVTPMAITIHTFLTFVKLRVNKLYVILWTLVSIGTFILSSLGETYFSIFYLISAIGYGALIITMIYLWKCLYNIRSI